MIKGDILDYKIQIEIVLFCDLLTQPVFLCICKIIYLYLFEGIDILWENMNNPVSLVSFHCILL